MTYKTPQKAASIVLILGIIGAIGTLIGIGNTADGSLGIIAAIGVLLSTYVCYVILGSLAEILHRLPEKKESKVETQETSEEEIIEILRKENHWDDDTEVDDK